MINNNIDKIGLHDDRVKSCFATLNGKRWHYLDAQVPSNKPQKGTIVLVHGFPDISLAWRYQIPVLLSLGFRCIALDCMGYGKTSTSSSLQDFSYKTHADAIATLCSQLHIPRIVIGGHDWGGMVVYRVAQWYPELVTHVFSVCTSFAPCTEEFRTTEELARGPVPQLGYQLQFGSEDGKIERAAKDEEGVRKFLLGMYGGRPSGGKPFMNPAVGVDLEAFEKDFSMTPLLSKQELDFYVKEYMRNGINGPCNWYRTRKVNWEDEKAMPKERRKTIKQPTLYILATKDEILTRKLSMDMERHIPNLTRGEVPAGHWALWQTPIETNAIIKEWIEAVVLRGKSKL